MYGEIKFKLFNKSTLLFSISSPLINTFPFVGFNNPKIIPIVVVFPQPFGPRIPIISFLFILKEIFLTASLLS